MEVVASKAECGTSAFSRLTSACSRLALKTKIEERKKPQQSGRVPHEWDFLDISEQKQTKK